MVPFATTQSNSIRHSLVHEHAEPARSVALATSGRLR